MTIEEWLRRHIAAGHRPFKDDVAPTELRPFKVKDDTTGVDESTALRGAHRKRRTAAAVLAWAAAQEATYAEYAAVAEKWTYPTGLPFVDSNYGQTCVDWPGIVEFWKYEPSTVSSDERDETGNIIYEDTPAPNYERVVGLHEQRPPGLLPVGGQRLHLPGAVGDDLDDDVAAAAAPEAATAAPAVAVSAAAVAVAAAAAAVPAAAVAAAAEAVAAAAAAAAALRAATAADAVAAASAAAVGVDDNRLVDEPEGCAADH